MHPNSISNHTHTANKSRRATQATGDRSSHKQLLKTPASLNCNAVVHYPMWKTTTAPANKPQLSFLLVHGVAFSDAPLVPERLGTLTLARASTSTKGNLSVSMGPTVPQTSPRQLTLDHLGVSVIPSPSIRSFGLSVLKTTEMLFKTFANQAFLF